MFSFIKRGRKKGAKGAKKSGAAMDVDDDAGDDPVEGGAAAEDEDRMDHALETAQLRFKLQCDPSLVPDRAVVKEELLAHLRAENMLGYYHSTCEHGLLELGDSLVKTMETEIAAKEKELLEREKECAENHGEVEVMEAQLMTAQFKALTGTKEEALAAYEKVEELTSMSTGQLIDVVLKKILLGLVWSDNDLVKLSIEKAEKLLEKGGDWDRRNRLKVYRGMFYMLSRNFTKASEDFLSAVATFTSSELCPYETFIAYTVLTSVVALDRVQFKKQVIDSPEVLSVMRQMPHLGSFLNTLYECDYKGFFTSLVNLNQFICTDRYLALHKDWFFREVRVMAYVQFLESYKSVTLGSMSKSFGVSKDFLEKELAHFISSRRINAKIDKVEDVIETCQPNETNARYQGVIRQGDLLLNRVQMLSRAINV